MTTSRVTTELFEDLAEHGEGALPARISGVLRIELVDGRKAENWTISVDKGNVALIRGKPGESECTLRCDKALFDQLVLGQENAMAAALRGDIVLDGACWRLLVALQRLLPDAAVIAQEAAK
jgi:hypothetical protein